MNGDWTPGPGWREVDYGAELAGRERITWDSTGRAGGIERMWVRAEPVPPLPTPPYTVIRAHWKDTHPAWGDVMWLAQDGTWRYGNGERTTVEAVTEALSGFEVLSEPRAVTARAVLDRVDALFNEGQHPRAALTNAAREFGVES